MAPTRGILMILSAITLFTAMGACIKATAPHVPPGQAVFFRAIWSLPLIAIWLGVRGDFPAGIRVTNWRAHVVRGVAGSTAMGLGFAGLAFLPLAEVTALRFITPVLLVVFAALILGERFRMIRLAAVLAGLVGVSIIVWPRLGGESLGTGAALGVALTLASAGLAALAQVFIKAMAGTERVTAIVFWFSLTAATLSLTSIPFGWVWPTGTEWTLLVGAGLLGGGGQLLLTSSYRHADAGALAPFTYVSMIWALLIDWFVFSLAPTWPMLGGAALVIAAGIVIVIRERQLGRGDLARRKVRAKGMM